MSDDNKDSLEHLLQPAKFCLLRDEIIFHCGNCKSIIEQNLELKKALEKSDKDRKQILDEYHSYITCHEKEYSDLYSRYKNLIERILPVLQAVNDRVQSSDQRPE